MGVENWDLIIRKDRLTQNNQSSLLPRNNILNILKYKYTWISRKKKSLASSTSKVALLN